MRQVKKRKERRKDKGYFLFITDETIICMHYKITIRLLLKEY